MIGLVYYCSSNCANINQNECIIDNKIKTEKYEIAEINLVYVALRCDFFRTFSSFFLFQCKQQDVENKYQVVSTKLGY